MEEQISINYPTKVYLTSIYGGSFLLNLSYLHPLAQQIKRSLFNIDSLGDVFIFLFTTFFYGFVTPFMSIFYLSIPGLIAYFITYQVLSSLNLPVKISKIILAFVAISCVILTFKWTFEFTTAKFLSFPDLIYPLTYISLILMTSIYFRSDNPKSENLK